MHDIAGQESFTSWREIKSRRRRCLASVMQTLAIAVSKMLAAPGVRRLFCRRNYRCPPHHGADDLNTLIMPAQVALVSRSPCQGCLEVATRVIIGHCS